MHDPSPIHAAVYATTPSPDVAQARSFLAAIDPAPGAAFGFRTFDDAGDDPRLAVKAYGTLDSGVRQSGNPTKHGKACSPSKLLAYMQGRGAGVFVVPNRLDGQGQRAANVVEVRALWADADDSMSVQSLAAFIARTGLVPSITVASGGMHDGTDKLHAYWRVTGCSVSGFTHAQTELASRAGTDPAVCDPARVMRLPGFWHQKGAPRMTRISGQSDVVYALTDFLTAVKAHPPVSHPRPVGRVAARRGPGHAGIGGDVEANPTTARLRALLRQHGGIVTPAVRALLREAQAPGDGAPGNRHATLLSVAAVCAKLGWPDADVHALVQPVVTQHWGGDRTQRLDAMLVWLREREGLARAAMPPPTPQEMRLAAAFAPQGGGR